MCESAKTEVTKLASKFLPTAGQYVTINKKRRRNPRGEVIPK